MIQSSFSHKWRHVLEAVAGIAAIVILSVGTLSWKLTQGPVSFGPITNNVENVLNGINPDVSVEVEDTVLIWDESDHSIRFQIVGLELTDATDQRIGSIPAVEVDMAVSDLLKGNFTPSRVELIGPSAVIVRRADGGFQLGLGRHDRLYAPSVESSESAAESPAQSPQFLSGIVQSMMNGQGQGILSALDSFAIRDAQLEFFDIRSRSLWEAPQAYVSIGRDPAGLEWEIIGDVRVGLDDMRLEAKGRFDAKENTAEARAKFSDVKPSSLAAKSGYFKNFEEWDFPVSGEALIKLDASGEVDFAEFQLNVGKGTMRIAEIGEEAFAVDYGAFAGSYEGARQSFEVQRLHVVAGENHATFQGSAQITFDDEELFELTSLRFDLEGTDVSFHAPKVMEHVVEIDAIAMKGNLDFLQRWTRLDELTLRIDGTTFAASGDIILSETTPAVMLTADVDNLPIDVLEVLWPMNMALGARDWVTRSITAGKVTKAHLSVNASPGQLAVRPIPLDVIQLDFRLEGAEVAFITGLPHMVGANANLFMTAQTLHAEIETGQVREGLEQPVNVRPGGTVDIPEMHIKGSPIIIDAEAYGTTKDILTLIDYKPLQYPTKFGIQPTDVGGTGQAKMHFSIPSYRNIRFDQIGFSAQAQMSGLSLPQLIGGIPISDGDLNLDIDLNGMKGEGAISIAGMPAKITWDEDFNAGDNPSSRFEIATLVDEQGQAGLGFDTLGAITGSIPVEIKAIGSGPKIETLQIKANLTGAEIDVEEFGFVKEVGEEAYADLEVEFGKDGAIEIKSLKATGDDLDVRGRIRLAPDGRLTLGVFERLYVGSVMDVAIDARREKDNKLTMKVVGEHFDVGPFLKEMLTSGELASNALNEDGVIVEKVKGPAWSFFADVNRLGLRGDVTLLDAQIDVSHSGERFSNIDVTGKFSETETLYASLTNGDLDNRHFMVSTQNAGNLVEGVLGIEQVLGGHLTVKMEMDDRSEEIRRALQVAVASETESPDFIPSDAVPEFAERPIFEPVSESPVNGILELTNFRIVKAPVFAKLLSVGSLQGLGDLLQGEGVQFDSLTAPFWMEHDGRVGLEAATAAGPSLGLTLFGTYSRGDDVADLHGTIVPAYGVNSILGNLPVLGPLLVSRDGEGVIGFTYGISGTTAKRTVFVNPLSGLAPGVLRRIFEGGASQEAKRVPVERIENNPAFESPVFESPILEDDEETKVVN